MSVIVSVKYSFWNGRKGRRGEKGESSLKKVLLCKTIHTPTPLPTFLLYLLTAPDFPDRAPPSYLLDARVAPCGACARERVKVYAFEAPEGLFYFGKLLKLRGKSPISAL